MCFLFSVILFPEVDWKCKFFLYRGVDRCISKDLRERKGRISHEGRVKEDTRARCILCQKRTTQKIIVIVAVNRKRNKQTMKIFAFPASTYLLDMPDWPMLFNINNRGIQSPQ